MSNIQIIDISGNSNKIIKSEDNNELFDIQKLIAEKKIEAQQIIDQANQEATIIKESAYNEALEQFKIEQNELLYLAEKKINNVYDKISNEIKGIVSYTLGAMGFNKIPPENIINLVETEVNRLKYNDTIIKLRCNPNMENYFNEVVQNNDKINYVEADETLSNNECILESEWCIFKINIEDAVKYINEIIK